MTVISITTHAEDLWYERTYELADAWTPIQVFREEIGLRAFVWYKDGPAETERKRRHNRRLLERAASYFRGTAEEVTDFVLSTPGLFHVETVDGVVVARRVS